MMTRRWENISEVQVEWLVYTEGKRVHHHSFLAFVALSSSSSSGWLNTIADRIPINLSRLRCK